MTNRFTPLFKESASRWLHLLGCFCSSVLIIVVLFIFSDRVNRRPNGFIRLFPPHPISGRHVIDLQFNSYYIAGVTKKRVYLGNHTTPAYLYSFDHQLGDSQKLRLTIPANLKFTKGSTVVTVDSPLVYLAEYRNSLILAGSFPLLNLHVLDDSTAFFEFSPASPGTIILQMENAVHNQNLLTKKNYRSPYGSDTSSILDRNHEGIITTDGMLLYDKFSDHLFYVYYYHNQFISLDANLNLLYSAKTIDTISSPHIRLSRINGGTDITMAAPPLRVNKKSCVNEKWLFVNSGLRANNEDENSFDNSSVIDVYALNNGKYEFSFHLDNYHKEKLKGFQVFYQEMIVLFDHAIYIYQLKF